jgi:hypothetical protein
VELLFGFLLLSGTLPKVVVLAGTPFDATLFFLGSEELIGLLPIYGAMLVYGSSLQLAQVVDAVPSLAHRSRPRTRSRGVVTTRAS